MDLVSKDYDPDFDSQYSSLKKGGYQWAGGWIDPNVKLSGYKEHPTLSVSDSLKKQQAYQERAKSDAIMARALYLAEGSGF